MNLVWARELFREHDRLGARVEQLYQMTQKPGISDARRERLQAQCEVCMVVSVKVLSDAMVLSGFEPIWV
jgi:hypothetical protein